MATDTKKKSESTDENAASTIKVGSDSGTADPHKPRRLAPLPSGKKKIAIVLAVLLVVIGGALLLHGKVHIGDKIYAQAAGHKIYKQDVKNLIGSNKGVTDHQAATVLADKYLTEALANEQGITVTDQDIQTAYGTTINLLKEDNKYSYQLQVNQLYFDRLQTYNQGVYKGYLLVGHFSRNIVLQPDASGQIAATDTASVAADKKYAQDFITNLYKQIRTGKITWDQAAAMEKADPTLGQGMYSSLSHSGPFNTSEAPVPLFAPASAQQQLRQIKPGQTSKPFAVSVTNSVGANSDQTFESYFLVVRMDSSAGGKSDVGFQQQLQQAKQRLGYKVNV
jgi:hypothetical protein